jgi:phage shock protein A
VTRLLPALLALAALMVRAAAPPAHAASDGERLHRHAPVLVPDAREPAPPVAVDAFLAGARGARARRAPVRAYGHAVRDGGRLWLQCWFFYPDNPQDRGIVRSGRHEGDWEVLQVGLGAGGRPEVVTFAQHSWHQGCAWGDVEHAGAAPVAQSPTPRARATRGAGRTTARCPDPNDEARGDGRRVRTPVRARARRGRLGTRGGCSRPWRRWWRSPSRPPCAGARRPRARKTLTHHSRGGTMAGMAGRMSTVIKAKISKLLDKAEDPGETLDYSYQKQLESLQNVKKGIADVVTAKKRLGMQAQKLEQSVVKLDTQARQALAAGNEQLARTALERKQFAQTELQSLDQQVAELQSQQDKLTESEKRLRNKIEAFRTKKEVIKAQYSAAEAQVRISEAATGVGEEMADVGLAMQRAVDKTEDMRARASAVEELEAAGTFEDLTQLGSGQDDIDRELAALGGGGMVDDELAKLKAELGQGSTSPPAELESGSGEGPKP